MDRGGGGRFRFIARDGDQILRLSKQAMFRSENRREGDIRGLREEIDDVAQLRIDRGGMGHEADTQSAQRRELLSSKQIETGSSFGHQKSKSAENHGDCPEAQAQTWRVVRRRSRVVSATAGNVSTPDS